MRKAAEGRRRDALAATSVCRVAEKARCLLRAHLVRFGVPESA